MDSAIMLDLYYTIEGRGESVLERGAALEFYFDS